MILNSYRSLDLDLERLSFETDLFSRDSDRLLSGDFLSDRLSGDLDLSLLDLKDVIYVISIRSTS